MSEPLLLIPGVVGDERSWLGAPDGTVMMSDATSIAAMAEDILARAPARFALAGHSMGGYIALAMLARAPERVARLALLSTSSASDDEAQAAARRDVMAAAEADYRTFAKGLVRAVLHPDSYAQPALREEMQGAMDRTSPATFLRQQRATLGRGDSRPLLATIAVPTLLLTGADDRIVPPHRSSETAVAITHATLVTIPRCGHMPLLEAPWTTRKAMEAWLAA